MAAGVLDRKIQQLIVIVAVLMAAFAVGLIAAQQAGLGSERAGHAVTAQLADDASGETQPVEALSAFGFEW